MHINKTNIIKLPQIYSHPDKRVPEGLGPQDMVIQPWKVSAHCVGSFIQLKVKKKKILQGPSSRFQFYIYIFKKNYRHNS